MEARRGRPPYPGILTPAEERVLELVRTGLTNAEIAVRLGLSISTVRYHLTNLHAKANSETREALRSWQPGAGRRNPLGLLGPLVPGLKWTFVAAVVATTGIAVASTIAVLANRDGTRAEDLWPRVGTVFEAPSGAPVIASQSRPALTKATLAHGTFIDLSPDGARWAERGDVQTPFGIYLVSSDTEGRSVHLSIVVDPGAGASIRRTPDGRAYLESDMDEAVEVGVYATLSTSREWLTTNVDDNGTVSLSPSNLPPDTVVDYASGAEVRLADAATSLTLSPLTGNYWTTCSELCHVVWHREPREMITTPMNATLSCSSDREVLLKSGALVLEMTSDSSEAFHGGCLAGDGSTLPAGAPLSSSPWVRIKAFLHDQQVDIVVTQDGHLRSGSANIGDQSCPCRVQP